MSQAEGSARPQITVVIPVFNRAGSVAQAVKSAVSQRCPIAYEVIVVDDGSTDDTAKQAADAGAIVISLERNEGVSSARNKGIAAARGEWVAFLDSDDAWAPNHLATLWEASKDVGLVASSGVRLSSGTLKRRGLPSGRAVVLRSPGDALRPENVIGTSACMIRTDVLRSVGGFDSSIWPEDLDLWLRVLRETRGRLLPDLTVAWRSHVGQMSKRPEHTIDRVNLMLGRHVAGGHLRQDARRGLYAVECWDLFRSGRRARGIQLFRPSVGRHIPRLLWSRFLQRRWRNQMNQARLLAELIAPDNP